MAIGLIAVMLANRFALMLVMLPQAPMGLTLSQTILTIMAYPVIAALAYAALGIRRGTAGEFTTFGGRT